jgi:hypothetical protein
LVFRYKKVWFLSACRFRVRFRTACAFCYGYDEYQGRDSFSEVSEECGFLIFLTAKRQRSKGKMQSLSENAEYAEFAEALKKKVEKERKKWWSCY